MHNGVLEKDIVRVEGFFAEFAFVLNTAFADALIVFLTTCHLQGIIRGHCFRLITTGIWKLLLGVNEPWIGTS